jgi:hypothetical protein
VTKRSSSLVLLLAVACSPAAAPEASTPDAADSASVVASVAPSTAEPATDDSAQDDSAQDEAPATAPGGTAPEGDPARSQATSDAPVPSRDVIYKATPEGLVVEADGVRFLPKAQPVKLANGGYGIRLEVTARVVDERTHTLLGHAHGPLSIAAIIEDGKGQQKARHADSRGDGPRSGELEILQPGQDVVLTRSWPSGSVKGPLWWGQKVRLQVGLWGLGADDEAPRPLRKLCTVDMVAGAKPVAVVSPPEL